MEWNFRDPQLDVASGRWVAHGEDYDPHTELRGFCNVYQNEDGQRAYCIELVVDGYAKQATTAEKLNATAGTIFADVLRLSCFTDAERTRGAGWLALEAAQADMPGRLLTVRCAHVRLIFSGSRWSRTLAVFAG